MEKVVNDEVDDEKRRNLIEEIYTRVNDEDENSIEVEEKEENITVDSESNTISKNDDNRNEICEGK